MVKKKKYKEINMHYLALIGWMGYVWIKLCFFPRISIKYSQLSKYYSTCSFPINSLDHLREWSYAWHSHSEFFLLGTQPLLQIMGSGPKNQLRSGTYARTMIFHWGVWPQFYVHSFLISLDYMLLYKKLLWYNLGCKSILPLGTLYCITQLCSSL